MTLLLPEERVSDRVCNILLWYTLVNGKKLKENAVWYYYFGMKRAIEESTLKKYIQNECQMWKFHRVPLYLSNIVDRLLHFFDL